MHQPACGIPNQPQLSRPRRESIRGRRASFAHSYNCATRRSGDRNCAGARVCCFLKVTMCHLLQPSHFRHGTPGLAPPPRQLDLKNIRLHLAVSWITLLLPPQLRRGKVITLAAAQRATQPRPSRASKASTTHSPGGSFLRRLLQRDLCLRGNVFALLSC